MLITLHGSVQSTNGCSSCHTLYSVLTDLARFKKLESLTLEAHHLAGIDWVAEALSHARCDELRSLVLLYRCECRYTCRASIAQQHEEISRLAGIILRGQAFRQLQTLSVSVDADLDVNWEEGLEGVGDVTELRRRHTLGLENVLQGCRDRGIQVEIEVNVYRCGSLPRATVKSGRLTTYTG